MKKSHLALAVLAAMPFAASAQNISVYGYVETGIGNYSEKNKNALTRSVNSLVGSSRLGFTGTEDLGGGLKATFRLEGDLTPSTGGMGGGAGNTNTGANEGAGGAINGSARDGMFSRESSLALSGAFGEIRIGKTDLSAAEGIDSLVGQFGNRHLSSGVELGSDSSNSIRYTSPTINGVTLSAGRFLNAQSGGVLAAGDTATTATTTKPQYGMVNSFAGVYDNGPLKAGIGYEVIAKGTSNSAQTAEDTKYTAFAIGYDFGVAKVGLFSGKRDVAASQLDITSTVISASAPLGNGYTLHAVNRMNTTKNSDTTDVTYHVVGLAKALSKRTSVYAIYERSDSDTATSDFRQLSLSIGHAF
jgi:predicted porin